jgi:predicted ABC-type ATPase
MAISIDGGHNISHLTQWEYRMETTTEKASYDNFLLFAKTHPKQIDETILKDLYVAFLQDLTSQKKPLLIAIGGGPGSGKTTFRKQLQNLKNVHLHDMDEVMVRLPGWKKDFILFGPKKAFENWWPTAREISELLVRFAIESRYSILYDRSCGAEGSYLDILRAKQKGYRISFTGLYVEKETALKRAWKREKEEGRGMTEAIVNEYRSRFSALWPYYLLLADEIALFDTEKETPRLIFSSASGIENAQLYQAFLEEGEAFKIFANQLAGFQCGN